MGRRVEPDASGYVDEYGFTPLTPLLEDSLMQVLDGIEKVDGGRRRKMTDSMRADGGASDIMELQRLGYLQCVTTFIDGRTSFSITSKAARYESELADYRDRRGRWVADREDEAKAARRERWLIAAFGILGSLVGAAIGAAATLAAVALG